MKRLILLITALTLLLSVSGATAASNDAYFSTYLDKPGTLKAAGSTTLTGYPFFNISHEGCVSWYVRDMGAFQADGYVKFSGTFALAKSPGTFTVKAVVYRKSDSVQVREYPLVNTSSLAASFSLFLFMNTTEYFQLVATQTGTQPNPLIANIFFEAIN